MKLTRQDLERISALTLEHYNQHAGDFFEGTRDHDVSQNIAALLEHIDGGPPYAILDFGCGPGRDLKTFSDLGHIAVGVDGAAQLVEMARAYSGCEVWQQDFLQLDLPQNRFDGVFANASLFHVASQELPRVLDDEGWNRGRYGAYYDLATWRGLVSAAAFVELAHYYRPPGLPRHQQPWLASVWRKRVSGGNPAG